MFKKLHDAYIHIRTYIHIHAYVHDVVKLDRIQLVALYLDWQDGPEDINRNL